MMSSPERAVFVDWREPWSGRPAGTTRAYVGHETCETALPPRAVARDLATRLRDGGCSLTLVTPFLTAAGLTVALRLVEAVQEVSSTLEVVCGDLGLLRRLARDGGLALGVSRLLAAQPADPRLLRLLAPIDGTRSPRRIVHIDGTRAELRRRLPSSELVRHHQTTWLDRPDAIEWLRALGVTRAEISNVGQGLAALEGAPGWSYTLHVPWVLVSVLRACPDENERLHAAAPCRRARCEHPSDIAWHWPGFPAQLRRRDNALYYEWPTPPERIETLPIDRVVVSTPG